MDTDTKPDLLRAAFQRAKRSMHRSSLIDEHRPWVWPLPSFEGRAPVIFDHLVASAFDPEDATFEQERVLLAYVHVPPPRDPAAAWRSNTRSCFLPLTPVYAVQDGEITFAEATDRGCSVLLDHVGGWATHYKNLALMLCNPRHQWKRGDGERVRAGDAIGYAGSQAGLRPLRFELWKQLPAEQGGYFRTVDPRPRMETWLLLNNDLDALLSARDQ